MIKSLYKNDTFASPFVAKKTWRTQNVDPEDLILWMSGSLTGSISYTYIDYGDGLSSAITNSYCDLALQQQTANEFVLYQQGLNIEGTFYPSSSTYYNTSSNNINTDGTYKNIVYNTNKQLFYNTHHDPTKIFGIENLDLSTTTRNLTDDMDVFTIPSDHFGEKIVPQSVLIATKNNYIFDDGNCNLVLSGSHFSNYQETFFEQTFANSCISNLLFVDGLMSGSLVGSVQCPSPNIITPFVGNVATMSVAPYSPPTQSFMTCMSPWLLMSHPAQYIIPVNPVDLIAQTISYNECVLYISTSSYNPCTRGSCRSLPSYVLSCLTVPTASAITHFPFGSFNTYVSGGGSSGGGGTMTPSNPNTPSTPSLPSGPSGGTGGSTSGGQSSDSTPYDCNCLDKDTTPKEYNVTLGDCTTVPASSFNPTLSSLQDWCGVFNTFSGNRGKFWQIPESQYLGLGLDKLIDCCYPYFTVYLLKGEKDFGFGPCVNQFGFYLVYPFTM